MNRLDYLLSFEALLDFMTPEEHRDFVMMVADARHPLFPEEFRTELLRRRFLLNQLYLCDIRNHNSRSLPS